MLCPVIDMLALAESDGVFPQGVTARQILDTKLGAPGKRQIPLNKEMGETFVFRALRIKDGSVERGDKPAVYDWFSRLLKLCGPAAGFVGE